MRKRIIIIGLVSVIAIPVIVLILNMFWGHISFDWKLCNQPNTKWVSDDESIVLYVENSCKITGTMRVNGEDIEVYVTEGPGRAKELDIYPIGVLDQTIISEEDKYEYWSCFYKSENEFVATVKKTTFYKLGQKIRFHKVEDITIPQ